MSFYKRWDAAYGSDCAPGCPFCDEPMEHTDRQALQAEHDNDAATIDALMGDTE